jgi:hypothetical protein
MLCQCQVLLIAVSSATILDARLITSTGLVWRLCTFVNSAQLRIAARLRDLFSGFRCRGARIAPGVAALASMLLHDLHSVVGISPTIRGKYRAPGVTGRKPPSSVMTAMRRSLRQTLIFRAEREAGAVVHLAERCYNLRVQRRTAAPTRHIQHSTGEGNGFEDPINTKRPQAIT